MRVKGKSYKNSDWDALILLNKDKITSVIEKEITFPIYDLEFETGEIINPMVYSENDWNLKYIKPYKCSSIIWQTIRKNRQIL